MLESKAFAVPSFNIIENFINDKTISFNNKKKAVKAVLDTPFCLTGNYIECYNSDGVLMVLRKKRKGKNKNLDEKRNSDDESSEEIDYMSDQMERDHLHTVKLHENKYYLL